MTRAERDNVIVIPGISAEKLAQELSRWNAFLELEAGTEVVKGPAQPMDFPRRLTELLISWEGCSGKWS